MPTFAAAWRRVWDKVIPFFAFPTAVRRVSYTTNAIESVNARLRKIIKTRGHFPSDEAATKLIWLALRNITTDWGRAANNWKEATNSRPRVSDDNAYAESLFRTAKYRPEFPVKGSADLAAARTWAAEFVRWYNHDHRHSGIRYVSPAQRHAGQDRAILAARHDLYLKAREQNPARWSGNTRNWTPIGTVTLNPERDSVIKTPRRSCIFNRWPHDRGDKYLDACRNPFPILYEDRFTNRVA